MGKSQVRSQKASDTRQTCLNWLHQEGVGCRGVWDRVMMGLGCFSAEIMWPGPLNDLGGGKPGTREGC